LEGKSVEQISPIVGLGQSEVDVHSRRRFARYPFVRTADWDFFTYASGVKPGYIENISQGGCLLRTVEPIEHRRWLRLVVREAETNLWFTAVGRVIRCEDKLESWDTRVVTLHRYGIEFIHPLNPVVLEQVQNSAQPGCATCGSAAATIPDSKRSNTLYCVLCHLRQACHNLLVQDGYEPEPA
jgi:hypothetical protein